MSEFSVSPADVDRAASGVHSAADSLNRRVHDLTDRVEKLLGSGWKGQAAEAFRRDWDEWLRGANDVVGGLDAMSSLLTSNAQQYSRQESANVSAIGQGGSGLLNMDL